MIDPQEIAKTYLETWNAPSQELRREKLEFWTEGARYTDPLMHGEGREQIAEMIEAARTQFPGHSFTIAGTPEGHGNHIRFSWALAPEGSGAVAYGTDFVQLDGHGRIAQVVGFLDPGAVA